MHDLEAAGFARDDISLIANRGDTATSQGATEKFLSYELTDCGLSGYSVSSGGDMPSESLSLNFAKISWTLTPVKSDGSGTPVTQGYDLTLSKTT